ncbi:MAG: bifunctional folylpolyglutamate synthase/dihydrofolate synthase [Magnetococcales bacterium]|nr:bifunctional folylpolyglutamate synthase/dihydrofolate synthase [Magnetococcales bacterium]
MKKNRLNQVLDAMALATPPGIHLGLERVEAMLQRLGHPERQLRVIHVAGTNGKGSVIAFLEAILRAQGVAVAAYTSPHLVRFNERIRFQGQELGDDAIAEALEMVLGSAAGIASTWFEKITVAALWLFANLGSVIGGENPDVVLLETGMGGRLDATNVVARPLMTLITAIGLDHRDYLGSDIATIAWEKGGILKRGVPALTSCGSGAAWEVLMAQAQTVGTSLQCLGRDFRYHHAGPGGGWAFADAWGSLRLPTPGLAGPHQRENAALAVAAIRCLARDGWSVSESSLSRGLREVHWPGRLQHVAGKPAMVLDGAHNPLGMVALAHALAEERYDPHDRTLVFSALKDKDVCDMAQILAPWVNHVIVVTVGGDRGRSTEDLQTCWQNIGKPTQCAVSFQEAWDLALAITPDHGQILVSGSLYLVGQACSLLDSLGIGQR